MQVDQNLPLMRIATLIATPLNSLVVLEESDITTPADLKGKTIGYSVGGFETVLLKVMLERAGLTLEDVKLVNVNFSLSPSLFAGQTDGVIGAFRNFELNQMDIEGRPGRAFFVEEQGIPAYDELIIISHRNRIGDKRLRHFVDALEEGVQYLLNHPQESWEMFIKGERKNLDDELNRRAWRDTLPRFALRPGALDINRYQRFADFLKEQEIISSPPPLANYAVELK
jgi:putative hydroxymethylpyrimidine transport system substrate-binding protein